MNNISRRNVLLSSMAMATVFATGAKADGLPKLAVKPTYKVGFAQTESNNP